MSRTFKLHEFCGYLGEQWQAIKQVYTEVEEVQYQFNEIHRQKMEEWQAALSRGVTMLCQAETLPPALAHSLLQVNQEERAKLEKEIADLEAKVTELRQEVDNTATEAQAEVQALREMNPALDAEEEELKARCAAIRQNIADLEAQMKATGLLSGILQRHRLGQQRDVQRGALSEATAGLRRVRQRWEEEKKRFQADQSRLHEKWEAAGIEAAQSQARRDYLQANLDLLSRQNGAARYLAELQAVPEAAEPLHGTLAEVVALNKVRSEYEQGLRAVAEALGLLKGLADGMERFVRSANKVLEEQRQYNLRELRVGVEDASLQFHALWPEFAAQVRDEKAVGRHPMEFSRTVREIIQSRLTDGAIAAMFESLGDSLTRATKAWG